MNVLMLLLMTTGALFDVSVSSGTLLLQEDESLFKKFGSLLGNAFGEAADAVSPDAIIPQAPAFMAQEQGAKPSEKEGTDFRARIEAHASVVESWLSSQIEMTAEQQSKLSARAKEIVEERFKKFAARRDNNMGNSMLPRTMPVLFAGIVRQSANPFQHDAAPEAGPTEAVALSEALIEFCRGGLLNEGQRARLKELFTEREQRCKAAMVEYLAAQIDRELFLSTDQRVKLKAALTELPADKLHPLYSFQPYSYYLPYQSLASLLDNATQRKIFDQSQQDRMTDLQGGGNGDQNLTFMSNSGPDEWQRQIREAGSSGRDMMMRAAELRIAWLRRELDLPEDQAERLRTAGKGASVQAVEDWKEMAQQTIAQMEQQMAQFQGNFGFGTQALDVNGLDQNPIWKLTLDEVTTGLLVERQDRSQQLREATTDMLVALLDEELWLTPRQVPGLRAEVLQSLPEKSNPAQHQEYIRELVLLAHPLFRVKEGKRAEFLMEQQQSVWKLMAKNFQFQNENFVQIQLGNNGGSFGFNLGQ